MKNIDCLETYSISIDRTCPSPFESAKYIDNTVGFKPYDERFASLFNQDTLGMRVRQQDDKEMIIDFTTQPGRSDFHYADESGILREYDSLKDWMIVNGLMLLLSRNLDRHQFDFKKILNILDLTEQRCS